MGTDTSTTRVHIAGSRVSQPLAYGGLSIPDPIIQSKSIRFGWGRKFLSPNQTLSWVRILEQMLREAGRPDIQTHLNLGFHDWKHTAMAIDSQFWSGVFNTIAELMALSHEYDRYWHLVPITGYELNDFSNIDQSSLSYTNPPVKNMVDAGLVNIGQLFHVNQAGLIDRTQPMKCSNKNSRSISLPWSGTPLRHYLSKSEEDLHPPTPTPPCNPPPLGV